VILEKGADRVLPEGEKLFFFDLKQLCLFLEGRTAVHFSLEEGAGFYVHQFRPLCTKSLPRPFPRLYSLLRGFLGLCPLGQKKTPFPRPRSPGSVPTLFLECLFQCKVKFPVPRFVQSLLFLYSFGFSLDSLSARFPSPICLPLANSGGPLAEACQRGRVSLVDFGFSFLFETTSHSPLHPFEGLPFCGLFRRCLAFFSYLGDPPRFRQHLPNDFFPIWQVPSVFPQV